jgi:hypothetical protein
MLQKSDVTKQIITIRAMVDAAKKKTSTKQ